MDLCVSHPRKGPHDLAPDTLAHSLAHFSLKMHSPHHSLLGSDTDCIWDCPRYGRMRVDCHPVTLMPTIWSQPPCPSVGTSSAVPPGGTGWNTTELHRRTRDPPVETPPRNAQGKACCSAGLLPPRHHGPSLVGLSWALWGGAVSLAPTPWVPGAPQWDNHRCPRILLSIPWDRTTPVKNHCCRLSK